MSGRKGVILDGWTTNPGDLSWGALEALCELTVHERTAPEEAAERIRALLSDASGWRERIEKIRSELIANFPDSAPVSAKEILRAVVEQQYAEAGKEVDSRE